MAGNDDSSSTSRAEIPSAIGPANQVLLVILLIGLGWMVLKLSTLEGDIASMIPPTDSSGAQADQAADEILARLDETQTRLDDLTIRLDQVCAIVSAKRPAASDSPCGSATP